MDCAGALHFCTTRIARLDAAGAPLAGAGNVYVSNAVVQIGFSPVVTEGQDYEQKNGCGDPCVTFKAKDKFKRYNLTAQICTPDPELVEMLTGGLLLSDGGDSVGWGSPYVGSDASSDNGVSVEGWMKAVVDGAQAAVNPWWRFVLTRTYWRLADNTLGESILAPSLVGYTEQNANWLDGPANDWIHDSDRSLLYARDADIPTATCGASTLIAS